MTRKIYLKFCITIFAFMLLGTNAKAVCELVESSASDGGYRVLQIGKHKLVDVDSFKEIGERVFYATSPVYGKPEIGMIDCRSDKRTQLVAPQKFEKAYPDGTDFFRLKDVIKNKSKGDFTLRYFHVPDVDSQDFKNIEKKKNLKSVNIPIQN